MALSIRLAEAIEREADRLGPALIDLSHRIHGNPELGLAEHKAAAWCADLLRREGFALDAPIAGMETAFRATRGTGRPAVSFLAEYDALPGIGHACGHNIIGSSAVGAGIVLARVLEAAGMAASVMVDGTPAEETVGGKIPLVAQGFYRDVDLVLSMHPDTRNLAGGSCLAVRTVVFSFIGRAAHAAAEPERGINALDAVIQTFNNINALRQHVRPDVRIHGIVTHGGQASNIVPDFAQADFSVRAADLRYFKEVVEKVRNCARAAALATGATLEIREEPTFEPVKENRVLTQLALETFAALGLPAEDVTGRCQPASTDFGNVSQVVPAIAPSVKIAHPGTVCHHPDFAKAAVSAEGDAAVVASTKLLAMMAAAFIEDPELARKVRTA